MRHSTRMCRGERQSLQEWRVSVSAATTKAKRAGSSSEPAPSDIRIARAYSAAGTSTAGVRGVRRRRGLGASSSESFAAAMLSEGGRRSASTPLP
ncbi:hypothetical protein WR25_08061 [Diploscapter pachys]|uniref:Uncharacterized protein n=1 Tax=Diploscapter pachys TaxID=2018661 RepID=A0A2A2KC71_9BILA|nr:hypothetical protein WR25_08061 [Diploscapter pachys]